MASSGFLIAKRKAAEAWASRTLAAVLPRNVEIERSGSLNIQGLFGVNPRRNPAGPRAGRTNVNVYLSESKPRLVGAVLSGTAQSIQTSSFICCRPAESVTIKLMDEGLPHEVTEKRSA